MLTYLQLSSLGSKNSVSYSEIIPDGLYETTDDYGTTYYFRGNVTNNYVYFAGYYWRIVRINGDGSIRLIYDGTSAHVNGESSSDRQIGTSAFNENLNDNAYIGYMYGTPGSSTYEATHANINDSTIKKVVDNWYKINIVDRGYENYIADTIYCNDRQIASDSSLYINGAGMLGYGKNVTIYASTSRHLKPNYDWKSTREIKMICSQKNDAFTVDDKDKGNGALTYPVGLLTVDETLAAVGPYGNKNYYLYTGQNYWTMSPNDYGSGAYVFYIFSDNYLERYYVSYIKGVRPVLSLKSSVELTGTGTITDPYVVQ